MKRRSAETDLREQTMDGMPARALPSSINGLGVITVDAQGHIVALNPTAEALLHIDAAEFMQAPLTELLPRMCAKTDLKRTKEAVSRALRVGQASTFELRLPGKNGRSAFLKVHVSPMHSFDKEAFGAVLTLEDITAYKRVGLSGLAHENARRFAEVVELVTRLEQQKERYRLQSIRDGLTDLYNHAHFQNLLAQEVARARRYRHPLSLFMIDIDDFKRYNDTFGHLAGDWALQDLAAILRESCRQTDLIARYGGEEFTVILPETPASGAIVVAERIRHAVERESKTRLRFQRPLTVSIGVAVYPWDGDSPQALLARADERLYRAKAAGKNRVWGPDPTTRVL